MEITSELEKLITLRDRGDLSQPEFEKAKALLLSTSDPEPQPPSKPIVETLEQKKRKQRIQFIAAVCATVAAALSGVSAIIDPNPLAFGILMIWVVASILWWVSQCKLKAEIEKL